MMGRSHTGSTLRSSQSEDCLHSKYFCNQTCLFKQEEDLQSNSQDKHGNHLNN